MVEDNKESSNPATGPKHRSGGHTAASSKADDTVALDAVLDLGIRVARKRIETCAAVMRNAEAAFGSRQDALLDAEPLLFEAQTILNAATMLRRIIREAETAKA